MPDAFLGDGLVFEERLPMLWEPDAAPTGAALARLNAANHQLLIALASLEESRSAETLKDESPALAHELQRLEYKLDVLLRLTAELAARAAPLPPVAHVRIAAAGLEWYQPSGTFTPGASGLLHVYLSAALPEPLRLPAVVVGELERAGERVVQLGFREASDAVIGALEKLIFRHHRRQIAGSRQHSPSHS